MEQNGTEIRPVSLKINSIVSLLLSYHKLTIIILVFTHVLVFHLDKLLFNTVLVVLFCLGFITYNLSSKSLDNELNDYLKSSRRKSPHSSGLVKFDWYIESSQSNSTPNEANNLNHSSNSFGSLSRSRIQFDQRSLLGIKPALTGSYAIDEELHSVIELVIRDYVDSWYKTNISSREDFDQAVRVLIYNSIRNLNKCLKSIEWEQYIINVIAHSLIIHMRIQKKAREKLRQQNSALTRSSEPLSTGNFQKMFLNTIYQTRANEKNLIEIFFDLEAEIEKGICRDCISYNSKEIQDEFLQEMSEFLCYSCLPVDTFNCSALRNLIREIFAQHLIKTSIDTITDPDYINQTILYLSQNREYSVENFMTTLNNCESIEELNELRIKLEENISRTRSNDKGGQNDQEIKLRLSSLAFVKRRIDIRMASLIKTINKISSARPSVDNSSSGFGVSSPSEEDHKKFLLNANLSSLSFETAIKNESIQLCFIEFMGKQNVQNLMSFYLNAEMFRQFARKELAKCSVDSTSTPKPSLKETQLAIKDFAKGLINSYLLSAVNFTAMSQDEDEQPINISNRIYYKQELVKTLEKLESEEGLNEGLLDDLQAKIYLLMKQKYYPEFKSYPEFHKILLKSDLLVKQQQQSSIESPLLSSSPSSQLSPTSQINANSSRLINDALTSIDEDFGDSGYLNDSILESSSSLDHKNSEDLEGISADRVSQSSFEIWPSSLSNSQDVRLTAIITSAGRCNDIRSTYAIYIIDVTKQSESSNKIDFWQTYRRFNDFNDLHMILKKRFPQMNIMLPGKSFKSSLNDELIEKRIVELNRYLQMITNQDMFNKFPGLLELMLKFLENKRWESQNSFKKKFGLLLNPMISSVQNIQTTLINAPDNVIGMVKGVSEMVLNEASRSINTSSTGTKSNQDSPGSNPRRNQSMSSHGPILVPTTTSIDGKEVIDRTVLNDDDIQSSNLLIRVILLLIDEIFDLKEKNQWLRQPIMAIVKSYLKNIKGDSMNRKIKEQIASYLSEKQIARYLKNFRKRMWPKGYLADVVAERNKNVKQITKLLAKTSLLSYVSDELRHILGNDTTRRGLFDLFDLFQHQTLNKRLLSILLENILVNLFQNPTSSNQSIVITSNQMMISSPSSPPASSSPGSNNFVMVSLRLRLSESSRVKNEWKAAVKSKKMTTSLRVEVGLDLFNEENDIQSDRDGGGDTKRKSSMSRSKSLMNEIHC